MYKYIKIIDDPLSYQALLNRSFELVKGYVNHFESPTARRRTSSSACGAGERAGGLVGQASPVHERPRGPHGVPEGQLPPPARPRFHQPEEPRQSQPGH